MKSKLIIAVAAFSGSLFAFPGLEKAQPNIEDDEATCVDLSGNWKGACKDENGKESAQTMNLVQAGCNSVTVNEKFGFTAYPGGKFSTSTVMPPGAAVASMSINDLNVTSNWNVDRTVLTMDFTGQMRNLDPTAATLTYNYKAEISRDGEKLLTKVVGTTQGNPTQLNCVYTK